MLKDAARDWEPAVKNSGEFVKHVVPAAVKPVHALWHELLGFLFLLFATLAGFRMYRDSASMSPVKIVMLGFFILVTTTYGISSIIKARRISRS